MSLPLITLTTDFGLSSPYAAAMKGAILSVNPNIHLIDLSHSLPPQELWACSWFLRSALQYFPHGTLHVIVVDPGVGSSRSLLYVEAGGQRLLVPDNGCWTEFARRHEVVPKVMKLTQKRYWREQVSATFHGRDILGPVAGYLSTGVRPEETGIPVETWVDLKLPTPQVTDDRVQGEVLFVDDFGNLITNLPAEIFADGHKRIKAVTLSGRRVEARQVRTYSDAAIGEMVLLVSSGGTLELAEVNGNAARSLGVASGAEVVLSLDDT